MAAVKNVILSGSLKNNWFRDTIKKSSKWGRNDLTRVSAQLNKSLFFPPKTALEKSLNSAPASKKSEESTTAFMNQVAELVQLVDSRHIMEELELK